MESTTYMVAGQEFELQHYGVKGMKWGVRRARGHAGLGSYATRKRELAGDKRDLEGLNKGRHLSYGLTKKRQTAFDARDKAVLEKRIAKNSERQRAKDEKKQFKKEVKYYKKHGMNVDYKINKALGTVTVTGYRDSHGNKIEGAYANAIMARGNAEKTLARYAGSTAIVLGASVVATMLGRS